MHFIAYAHTMQTHNYLYINMLRAYYLDNKTVYIPPFYTISTRSLHSLRKFFLIFFERKYCYIGVTHWVKKLLFL